MPVLMSKLAVIILAAGQGKRFGSARPKIMHHAAGRSLVEHVLAAAQTLRPERTILVVSPGIKAEVSSWCAEQNLPVEVAVQETAQGTGDAVLAARSKLRGFSGQVLILAGDVPLVQPATLRACVRQAQRAAGSGVVLAMEPRDPHGYGRVCRDADGRVAAIVEQRDADAQVAAIREVNTGIFCCDAKWLFRSLSKISKDNAQGEYYLTDIAAIAAVDRSPLDVVVADDADEFWGVNSRSDLAVVESLFRLHLTEYWMARGVTFQDPDAVQLDVQVKIGQDTIVERNVSLRGETQIGRGCILGQGAILTDMRVGSGVRVLPYSVMEQSRVADDCQLGPFARLRPESRLDAGVRIGNFVELKKTHMKAGAKANHLTYLGDATIGKGSNIGCGTITCNYDGVSKHKTVIGEGVFVGSDCQFVAPVRIGADATIAAGSVITENVPKDSLAIARGRQVIKRQWKRDE